MQPEDQLVVNELEAEIKLLESLPHTHAYTGELEDLKCKSYVDYSLILKLLNEKKEFLRKFRY